MSSAAQGRDSGLAGTTAAGRTQGAEAGVAPGGREDARPGDPSKVGEARSAATTQVMREFYAQPFTEPDGSRTWCVRKSVYGPDLFSHQIVSWHPTREEAQEEVERRYGREYVYIEDDLVEGQREADTRSFRRGLIRAELGMPGRYGPGLLRRLRLGWQLWKVNREPAP